MSNIVKSINPENLGNTLNSLLTTKDPYKNLTYINLEKADNQTKQKVIKYISDVYQSYIGIPFNINIPTIDTENPQPGDVVFLENRYYLITMNANDKFITWPRSEEGIDREYFSTGIGIKTFSVIRPELSNIKNDTLKTIDDLNMSTIRSDPELNKLFTEDAETINTKVDIANYGDGVLQIGDLIFLVDPTQIAFNTQNGYQYFPTIRTHGNPKIPTMQQIKNVSITLIFPNEDSINYQLLNLYAMYKRTPFVNIRNKDICLFFQEICQGKSWPSMWLSVGLESIQIQSVQGFPNTLQANITILPFDHKVISNGFKALLSFSDVKKQQAILYRNREFDRMMEKIESKLNDQSNTPEKFLDVISKDIKKSPDFRQSLPFRAFYQSLIEERPVIKDEMGNMVQVSSSTDTDMNIGYSLSKYRPKNKENLLHEYKAESNQGEIVLTYRYLTGDYRNISKQLSNQKTDYQVKVLQELTNIKKNLISKEGLVSEILTSFYTKEDFFKQINSQMEDKLNIARNLLTTYGITLDDDKPGDPGAFKPVTGLFSLIWRGLFQRTGIETFSATMRDISKLNDGRATKDNRHDPMSLMNGLVFNPGAESTYENSSGAITAQGAIDKIWTWLDTDEKKNAFSGFLHDMRLNILDELGANENSTMIITQPNEDDPFKVIRLPITDAKVIIDNKKDIIIGWSLIFSNKFVPITLQAFKYPYYQHIGCEDATISLNITSTSEKGIQDFKSQLSLLSERIYETIKAITLNAPELIAYLDSRITIETTPNNIFKVFGVNKVVFDNSSTANIIGQPNTWTTTLNLTQANFTIDQYHSIESVPSNNNIVELIAKIFAGLKFEGNKFLVNKYETRSNISTVPSQDTPNWVPASLDDILKFRFINSKWGTSLLEYIKEISSKGEKLLRERKETNKLGLISGGNPYSGFTFEKVEPNPKDVNTINAQTIADDFTKREELRNQISSYIKELPDENATIIINELLSNNESTKILQSLIYKFDQIFEQEYKVLINLLKPNMNFFQSIIYNFQKTLTSSENRFWASCLVISLIWGSVSGPLGDSLKGIATVGLFLSTVGNTLLNAGQDAAINSIVNKFQGFFTSIMDNFNNSIVIELADKIFRDPIIRDKLLSKSIIGNNGRKEFENSILKSKINCYNDFDVPYINDNLALSPDFYLYNDVLNDYEVLTYFNESMQRYVKIDKLTSMMSLIESEDTIKKYDELLQKNNNISDSIINGTQQVIFKDFGDNVGDAIKKLQDLQVQVARSSSLDENTVKTKLSNAEEFKKQYPREKSINKEEWDKTYENYFAFLEKQEKGLVIGDIDKKKINLIYSARMKTLLEIFEVYININMYMVENLHDKNLPDFYGATKESDNVKNLTSLSKNDCESTSIDRLYNHLSFILENASSINSDLLTKVNFSSQDQKESINSLNKNLGEDNFGLGISTNGKFTSLPNIKMLQSYLYNKIGYYIRLNSVVNAFNQTGVVDISTVPELKFLNFWNFRAIEENIRRTRILKEFYDNYNNTKNTTIQMFPTFKLFFKEEDKGIFRNFDDFYTYNAIQSIEIVSNKNSASTTAVIRLSNVTNSITDQMSFMRERAELLGYSIVPGKEPDNLFFGTLDVKPGTAIMIKLGYAPFDNLLKTVFQGRIIEMNMGPMCEIVCQSYSTQLNHHIVAEKFGVLSTVREHGDVASAILDMIPGLEKLGKISMFGLITSDFSGKNIRKVRGKFMDNFLLGNILGNLSASANAQDNPRDENIYLPYSYSSVINLKTQKSTFDWVIFDQSVWDALQELTLYHRNVIVTTRNFNDDSISSKGDLRETLVIGDKSGFFKYTDAFALSSLNIKDIETSVSEWNLIKDLFRTNPDPFRVVSTKSMGGSITGVSTTLSRTFNLDPGNNSYRKIFAFLQNELNALVVSKLILDNKSVASPNIKDMLIKLATDNKFNPDLYSITAENIIKFSRYPSIPNENLSSYDFSNGTDLNEQAELFQKILKEMYELITQKNLPIEINPKLFYEVKTQVENIDEKLMNNIQYKKIQQHHLLTDVSNIISNNISLNSQFANMVNVYYHGEPSFKTANINKLDFNKDLNIWPVKAFGDVKDEYTRILNSYQKNIDTNWFDTIESVEDFYKREYRKETISVTKNGVTTIKPSKYSINTPQWDLFPSFIVVGVNLLKQQVEKMYQGTIEIIGNPNIQPFDIIHIQDYTNDMHGAVEVEEVIHTFTPEIGYRTVITPNLITYDRDPIQMQDTQVINQIYDFANLRRVSDTIGGFAGGILTAGAGLLATLIPGPVGMGLGAAGVATGAGMVLWNGLVGSYKRYHKFLYDQLGNILGRDCINFTSLLYHGMPYMAGFEGVDYTNLKTLMNHNILGIQDPISRLAAFSDPLSANIVTDFDPSEFSLMKLWTSRLQVIGGWTVPVNVGIRLKGNAF